MIPLIDEFKIANRIKELGRQISKDYKDKQLHLLAVPKGSLIFLADLIRAIDLDLTFSLVDGRKLLIDANSNILIVEDIADSGETLFFLQENMAENKFNSLKTIVLLNKPSKRKYSIQLDYIGFEIPDNFVIGYGLDYLEYYRNLRNIHILEESDK
jgi:hypoxanthine phosphoribosyltransferase